MRKRIAQANLNDPEQIADLIKYARDDGQGGEFQKGWPEIEVQT